MSLIEVQVALLLLLVGVLTAVGLAPMGMRGVDLAEKSTFVTQAARRLMEYTVARPFDSQAWAVFEASSDKRVVFTSRETLASEQPESYTYVAEAPEDPVYSYRVDVDNLPDDEDAHRIQVTVYRQRYADDPVEEVYRLVTYRVRL